MFARNAGQILITAVALAAFCSSANAEKTVYKWVDAEGHVHFSDAPPPGANPADAETLVIPKSPAYEAPAQPAVASAAAAAPVEEKQAMQPGNEVPV